MMQTIKIEKTKEKTRSGNFTTNAIIVGCEGLVVDKVMKNKKGEMFSEFVADKNVSDQSGVQYFGINVNAKTMTARGKESDVTLTVDHGKTKRHTNHSDGKTITIFFSKFEKIAA